MWRRAACPKIAPGSDTVFAVARSYEAEAENEHKNGGGAWLFADSFQFGRLPISRGDRTREIVEAEGKKQKREGERERYQLASVNRFDYIIVSCEQNFSKKRKRGKKRRKKRGKNIRFFFATRRAKKIRYFPSFRN